MERRVLSLLLAIWMISMAFVGLAYTAKGADVFQNANTRIFLDAKNYPNVPANWYAPGDSITGYLEGRPIGGLPPPADGLEDTLDVVVADGDPALGTCPNVVFANIRLRANNVVIDPTTGRGPFSFSGDDTKFLSDGYYCAWVAPGDYIENSGAGGTYIRSAAFWVHMYRLDATTEYAAYIPGNTVKVLYTVTNIMDGSLVTDTNFSGEWAIISTDRQSAYDGNIAWDRSAGSFTFTIINSGGVNPAVTYPVWIWWNGTKDGARRAAVQTLNVAVGNLGSRITSPPNGSRWAPNSLMEIDVSVYVTVGGQPAYRGALVDIKILDGATPTSSEIPGFGGTFPSNGLGQVSYLYQLSSPFASGRTYTILVNATSILKYSSNWINFDVRTVAESISVRMTFDRASYFSGDGVNVTVATQPPAGHPAVSNYFYEVTSGTAVFARTTTTSAAFTFAIPSDFQGNLDFGVEVYNSVGDYGTAADSRQVSYGVVIVNANPPEYNANDVITVNYQLTSKTMGGAGATYYYKVLNPSGTIVQEGTIPGAGTSGSYSYTVPNVPTTNYRLRAYVSEGGKVIYGEAQVYLVQGFIMTIKFDKTSYVAGDTMKVDYTISPRAGTPLPAVFILSYGLIGLPTVTWTTTSASGTVEYKILDGANEGSLVFGMAAEDASTGAQIAFTDEVVLIGTQPGTIGGIELFDAFLLVLIVILFLLMLAFRFRGAPSGGAAPKPKEEKAAPPPPPGPSASPMIMNCKACGAPIEITTSKRPIEVMCPSCGETAMVQ